MNKTDKIKQEVEGHMGIVRAYLKGNANHLEDNLDDIFYRLLDIQRQYPSHIDNYKNEIEALSAKLGFF